MSVVSKSKRSFAGVLAMALLGWLALGGEALAQDSAGVFFYGAPPSIEEIVAAAPGANVTSARDGRLTRITVAWPDVTATINVDPDWNREVQLSGMRGWISQFPAEERAALGVQSLVDQMPRTTTCYGMVISPRYDAEGKVVGLILRLLQSRGGFVFSHQSFYSEQGARLIGLLGDPDRLGALD